MAFVQANFAPVGNTSKPPSGVGTQTLKGAPSVWSYATPDTKATVDTSGYFHAAAKLLNVGDLIYAVTGAGSGGTLAAALLVVNSNTGGVVDVVDGTAITMTDTD